MPCGHTKERRRAAWTAGHQLSIAHTVTTGYRQLSEYSRRRTGACGGSMLAISSEVCVMQVDWGEASQTRRESSLAFLDADKHKPGREFV